MTDERPKAKLRDDPSVREVYVNKCVGTFFDGGAVTLTFGNLRTRSGKCRREAEGGVSSRGLCDASNFNVAIGRPRGGEQSQHHPHRPDESARQSARRAG